MLASICREPQHRRMFIKRNRSRQQGKTYTSVLLVEGVREALKRPRAGRPKMRQSKRAWCIARSLICRVARAADRVDRALLQRQGGDGETPKVQMGSCYGALAGLHALAGELGLVAAVGSERMAKLALFLIYARVARRAAGWPRCAGPRPRGGRGAGVESFDEDDLYGALEWLEAIRNASSGRWLRRSTGRGLSL